MAIIIPEARTPFQQTRQPRQSIDGPDLGDVASVIGEAAYSYGVDQLEHDRAQQMQSARVEATEKIGALRDQYEQDPNLDGLSDRFAADVEKIKTDLIAGLPNGKMQEEFDLDFRGMVNPQARAISKRQYALQRDAALAGLNSSLRTYNTEAANAPDQESRDAILKTAAADIGAAEAAGWLSATDADALIAGTYGDAIGASALKAIQDDPQDFLDRVSEGEFADMDPKKVIALTGQAKAAVASEEARLQKAEVADAKRLDAVLKSDVQGAVDIIESGLRYDELPTLMDRAEGTPYEATLRATLAAAQTEGNFTLLDPADQQLVIDQVKQSATQDPEDVARLNRLRSIREKTIKSLASDPLRHVSDRGLLPIEPVDISDPSSVLTRVTSAETVATEFQGETPQLRYFTNGERDAFKSAIEDGGADDQLSLATQIVQTFGDRASAALSEVGAQDPIFHLAGQLVLQTEDIAAARTILQGRDLLKDKTGAKPNSSARAALLSEFTAAFPPADRQRVASLFEAADAHYAAAGLSVDPEADAATLRAAYTKSVQAASAQLTHGGVAYGGIQRVNDRPTLLPSNVSAELAEFTLSKATTEAWLSASVSGGEPMIGGKPLSEADSPRIRRLGLGDLRLMSVGGGQYLVGIERSNGSPRWFTDEASIDGLYHVDLEALTRAVREVQ